VTVHDLSFELFPEFFSPRDLLILRSFVRFSARRAARVIAVSQSTKRDLVDLYGLNPDQIVVTHEAPAAHFRPASETEYETSRTKYGLHRPFILAVGNLQPRKNLLRLIDAYGQLRASNEIQHQLVIVGKAKWREAQVFQLVQKLRLEQEIVFTGYISDSDLRLLYAAADLFAYPSLYEGFGLPVLEAMACGAPVVTSDVASIPEVAGEAAILVDPRDVNAIAKAIHTVLTDADVRRRLKSAGLERVKMFSWEKTARQTLDVYQQVFQEKGRFSDGRKRRER